MMGVNVGLVTLMLGVAGTVKAAVTMPGPITVYAIEATLGGTGGVVSGTFVVEADLLDEDSSAERGRFDLTNYDLRLTGTTLFVSATSGRARSLGLLQRSDAFAVSQELHFDFIDDEGYSGAFGYIEFGPFTGDPNVIAPFGETLMGGYMDGNGTLPFESVTLTVVPEPRVGGLVLVVEVLFLGCRRKGRPIGLL